jgi:hypothetical protein
LSGKIVDKSVLCDLLNEKSWDNNGKKTVPRQKETTLRIMKQDSQKNVRNSPPWLPEKEGKPKPQPQGKPNKPGDNKLADLALGYAHVLAQLKSH